MNVTLQILFTVYVMGFTMFLFLCTLLGKIRVKKFQVVLYKSKSSRKYSKEVIFDFLGNFVKPRKATKKCC